MIQNTQYILLDFNVDFSPVPVVLTFAKFCIFLAVKLIHLLGSIAF